MKISDKAQRELEGVVDAVAHSYTLGRAIDSLDSTALPNRRKIVEALHHLEHVVFMGFYSTKVLNAVNLRHYIAEHLHAASEVLIEQIARALCYARKGPRRPRTATRATPRP